MKLLSHLILTLTLSSSHLVCAQTNTTYVGANGTFVTHDGAQIGIFGDLENDGTFANNGSNSEVGFYNTSENIEISGTNTPDIANLIIDVPQDLILNVNTNVNTGVLYLDGHVITPRNTADIAFNLINTDLVINSDNERHKDGYNSYIGTEAFTFPIGNGERLRPISIENGSSINTSKAAYFFEDAAAPLTFPLSLDTETKTSDVFNVSNFEFWDLNGDTPTRVTLTWDVFSNISQILNSANLNNLIVTGWNIAEQQWKNLGNFGVIGNLSSGSITSRLFNPNDYEAITFATSDENLELGDVELVVFNGLSNGNNDGINDYFAIKNISRFPENNLKIFNRWGVQVYEANNYDAEPASSSNFSEPKNVFRGKSEGRVTIDEDNLLPEGTYFYVLNYLVGVNGGEKTLAGYLYINR